MLVSLHVKNLALIEEAEVEFGPGLNILSGETGAGKSIIIGSINLALGEKVPKEMLRENAEYALVELIFSGGESGTAEAVRGDGYFSGKWRDYYVKEDYLFPQYRKNQFRKCIGVLHESGSGTTHLIFTDSMNISHCCKRKSI